MGRNVFEQIIIQLRDILAFNVDISSFDSNLNEPLCSDVSILVRLLKLKHLNS